MIRQASIIPDSEADAVFSGSRARIYPWDEWFDGQARKLVLAEHLPTFKNLKSAVKYIYARATKRGIRVEIRRHNDENAVTIRAIAVQGCEDAPDEDMEARRTDNSNSLRKQTPSIKRGKLKSRRRTG